MIAYTSSLLLLGASSALANPLFGRQAAATVTVTAATSTPTPWTWNAGAVNDYTIHGSCNATQSRYIRKGLEETKLLTRQARDHILRWGNSSQIYQKYFGDAPTGEPLGWFAKIVDGNKAGIVFRCDNIDGNCKNPGWAGHWRGANATSETVICDLSYELRRPLEGLCGHGYTVSNGATNFYWASDLLHRLLHVPLVGEGVVEHYGAEGKYPGVIALAKTNSTYAVRNSDTLQYFALEVYAYDIANPGVGCAGVYTSISSTAAAAAAATSSVSRASSSVAAAVSSRAASTPAAVSAVPSSMVTRVSSAAAAAGSCTPHDDHWHCPAGVAQPTYPPS